ncbi:hypothetical protein ASD8599_01876 [Ascidiaceihabitans donghaensis]|uniref:SnoaL-like domain-containing protein n=1 Tax=Ascidiaceihabitans donghaensis TaxID=1510460 RepID=A0A2R8BDN6_9RHOB|nr:nuclear transport factor 2 family protein [Ascidiaceihabitans donghaensis]SPH21131.1 hypothetical protein ASD8599_01876 [Ascidiaceihabitans donghaensis]
MENKHDILKRYYKDVWERGNLDAIDAYFDLTSDADRLLPDRRIEPGEIREWVGIIRSYVTDIDVKIIKSIEEGDWISAFMVIECRRLDTGQPVKAHQHIMLRFTKDKKVESYPQFDFLQFFEQIGLLPENSLELLMGGTRLN